MILCGTGAEQLSSLQQISKTLSLGSLKCCFQLTDSQFASFHPHCVMYSEQLLNWVPFSLAGALVCCTGQGHTIEGTVCCTEADISEKKSKNIKVRASPRDSDFCCVQQEAGDILCIGEDTLCRHRFVPYKVKIGHRWAKSLCINPLYRRKNSKLCGDWNFTLYIGASHPYTEDDAPLEYLRLMRLGMEEEFLCTENMHIFVERRAVRAWSQRHSSHWQPLTSMLGHLWSLPVWRKVGWRWGVRGSSWKSD